MCVHVHDVVEAHATELLCNVCMCLCVRLSLSLS